MQGISLSFRVGPMNLPTLAGTFAVGTPLKEKPMSKLDSEAVKMDAGAEKQRRWQA